MKNKVFIFLVVFISILNPVFAEVSSPVDRATDARKLSFITLMEKDAASIEDFIKTADEKAHFQLGILQINHILVTDKLAHLNDGIKNLDRVSDRFKNDPLYLIYRGMSEAFLARRLTLFGIPNIKKSAEYMTSLPDDYPDWYIRLLRGMSFYNLGAGLPEIGLLKESKEQALETGKNDLMFVLDEHSRNSSGPFKKETYDWDSCPVPDDAADFALEVLTR